MNCKNCDNSLRTDYSFCPDCGAKVIRNRITIKNLWYDAVERFFNVDNTFLVTFKSLFTVPDQVIVGYINGVRKKYLNPISYFTIAVTLGGLFVFINKQFFPDAMNYAFQSVDGEALNNSERFGQELGQKVQEFLFEYQSLFYVLMLPVLALISKLVFIDKKQYNLSEHFVINLYGYSQMSICINIIYIFIIWNAKLIFYVSTINLFIQIAYFTFVLKRIFKVNMKNMFLRLLIFLGILLVVYIGIVVLAAVYLALFTDTFKEILPK